MNLWFDECLPPKWCRSFSELLERRRPPVTATHLLGLMGQGTPDDQVVTFLQGQPGPLVLVSGDSGSKTVRGDPRLCALCPQARITCVIISRRLCQEQGFEKIRMLFYCLPAIERAAAAAPGTRFRLERSGPDSYHIRVWPIAPATPITPPPGGD